MENFEKKHGVETPLFRPPETAARVEMGIIPGITDKWNTEALYEWSDGYWEVWVDSRFAKEEGVSHGAMTLVASGEDRDGWKNVDTASFCKKNKDEE